MKPTILKLIRKVLKKVEKSLDVPHSRIKQDKWLVRVHEYSVYITDRTSNMTICIATEDFYKIKDQIKSYKKKNEQTGV
jgi:hypothetical protein